MSPELYFALTLLVRMAVTAAFLIAATVTAERAGPLIGGLVATLPISAGPIYIFLAIDHGAHFVGESALGSAVMTGMAFTTPPLLSALGELSAAAPLAVAASFCALSRSNASTWTSATTSSSRCSARVAAARPRRYA